jgi:hypothetical protein
VRASNSDYTNIELRQHQQQQHNAVTIFLPLTTTTATTTTTLKECVVDKNDSTSVALLQNTEDSEIC